MNTTATAMKMSVAGPGISTSLNETKYSSQFTSATTGLWQSFISRQNKFITTIPCPMIKVHHKHTTSQYSLHVIRRNSLQGKPATMGA